MVECRICFERDGQLIAPCQCTGTAKYVHRECLQKWRQIGPEEALKRCEICNFEYQITSMDIDVDNRATCHLFIKIIYDIIIGLGLNFIGTVALVKYTMDQSDENEFDLDGNENSEYLFKLYTLIQIIAGFMLMTLCVSFNIKSILTLTKNRFYLFFNVFIFIICGIIFVILCLTYTCENYIYYFLYIKQFYKSLSDQVVDLEPRGERGENTV